MKQTFCLLSATLTLLTISSFAQSDTEGLAQRKEWKNPKVSSVGRAPMRNEFISYDIREVAQQQNRNGARFYMPLNDMFTTTRDGIRQLRTRVEIPYLWLDKDIFLHIEGVSTLYVTINDKVVGYATDSRVPVEFNISKDVKDGLNTIAVEFMTGGCGDMMEGAQPYAEDTKVYIYAQPKLRIEDYTITTPDDSTGRHSIFTVQCAVANSYNSDEKMTVGYDIYSPAGKLLNFDMLEVTIPGNGRDTVTFEHIIYGTEKTKWTAENPQLYRVMLFVKRDGRLIEYIPLTSGLSVVGYNDEGIMRNGKQLSLKAVRYNAQVDESQTETQIKHLKAHGVNTICVDYPQKKWFYDMCDRLGMNVIDQANINSNIEPYNRNIGGSLSNNPAWKQHFVERMEGMYKRAKDHVCIIGWSLGGHVGNGYNMYKAYQWIKGADSARVVMFDDAAGEWNSDMPMPEMLDVKEILAQPIPKKQTTRRR